MSCDLTDPPPRRPSGIRRSRHRSRRGPEQSTPMPRSTHAIAPTWRWHSLARRQPETPVRVGGRRGHLWQLWRGVPCGTRARTCANSERCRTAQRHRQHMQMHLRLRMASWRKVISSSSRESLDRTCNTTCRWANGTLLCRSGPAAPSGTKGKEPSNEGAKHSSSQRRPYPSGRRASCGQPRTYT